MITHKKVSKSFKKVKLSIFCNCNATKLEVNNNKNIGNYKNAWKLKNILIKTQLIKKEIKK
jgi:hypothetical protein